MTTGQLLTAGLALPLLGFIINRTLGPLRRDLVGGVGSGVIFASFACFAAAAAMNGGGVHHTVLYTWSEGAGTGPAAVPRLGFDLYFDGLAAVMTLVVTGVGALIHVYSGGYMADEDDAGFARFFGHMNLFVFSMLLLVLAHNFVLLVVGWALVGLSSYLLIGFWHDRPTAVAAARKAFVMNVIGDVGIVIASFVAFSSTGGLGFDQLFGVNLKCVVPCPLPIGTSTAELIAFLLLIGAVAKSAQIPLHTWLPDAMEGPTPVSALIHAATMVTAGVYLVARFHPLFAHAPAASATAALIGAATALMAALIATVQTDIKRVLAYSTMSQIGYMFFAVAIGAGVAGMFHLVTHAFFKALLFLAAGNVIHALHGEQDIRNMGGLWKRLPGTSWAFLIGALALSGIPPLAGFFSKDEILAAGTMLGPLRPLPAIVLLLTAGLTAYYMLRVFFIAFLAPARTQGDLHEAPLVMAAPVAVLAVLAVVGGLLQPGPWHVLTDYIGATVEGAAPAASADLLVTLGALTVVVVGVGTAYWRFGQRVTDVGEGAMVLRRAFYWDAVYDGLVVRPLRLLGDMFGRGVEQPVIAGAVEAVSQAAAGMGTEVGRLQSGYLRSYATVFAVGGLVLLVMLAMVVR